MFEGILEKVLARALGNYLEGLDKKNLSLGVWSGNINLENVYIKRHIFNKMKLPLNLLLGRIGKLQIIVPWRSLSSSPVELYIESPKGKEEWELIETFQTNFELKEQLIQQYAIQKTQEAEQEEKGFWKNLVTKILDNVQVTIKNIHVRLENYQHFRDEFSFGITLKEINLHTTNHLWEKDFFDRTKDLNQKKPIFKLLQISQLGFYWKTKETYFLGQEFDQEDDRLVKMHELFKPEHNIIEDYKESYLIQPIELTMKLQQNTLPSQLEKEAEFEISLNVDEFSICLQKSQFNNIVKLMDMFNDYASFQDAYQQTRKYKYLRPIYSTPKTDPKEWFQYGVMCILKENLQWKIKKNQFQISQQTRENYEVHFKKVFISKLYEEIRNIEKQEGLSNIETEEEKYEREHYDENKIKLYQHVVMAIEFDILKEWASHVAQDLSQKFQEQKNIKNNQTGLFRYITSVGSYWLGAGKEKQEEKKQQIQHSPTQRLDKKEDIIQKPLTKSPTQINKPRSSLIEEQSSEEEEFFDAQDQPFQEAEEDLEDSVNNEFNLFRNQLIENFQKMSEEQQKQNSIIEYIEEEVFRSDSFQYKQRQILADNAVPNLIATFNLKYFSLQLINKKENKDGVELYSKNFTIQYRNYDANKNSNINSYELIASNEDFGINSFNMLNGNLQKQKLVEKIGPQNEFLINQKDESYLSRLKLSKGNLKRVSGVGQHNIIENIDFDLQIEFNPVQITYQVTTIEKLQKFLKLKDFQEELKVQAYEKLEALRSSSYVTDVLKNKKKNKIMIAIASPILVIPLKKNTEINSECWIFNMGNLLIQNYEPTQKDFRTLNKYKSYQVNISKIMMQYIKSNQQWLLKEYEENYFWKYE